MSDSPLAGLRVLDLSWVMVGPMSGRYLADLGADVIKVESSRRRDPLRGLGPFKDAKPDPERTFAYQFINAGKRSITLDLNQPAGRDIVLELVRRVDVVIESFRAGVLDRMKLGWADLSAANPRLVMASTCLFGQTGPDRETSGVGTLGAAYSGASLLTGWPDRMPVGPYGAWTDSVTPRFIVAAILAALRQRAIDGQGRYIDVAQAEAGLQFLLPAYYDYAANHRKARRAGADVDPLRSPSGVFPCAGEDRWVSIDASAAPHWQALRRLAAGALDDPCFDTLVGRLRARDALHENLAAWTRARSAEDVEGTLQAASIPAHVVCDCDDLATDPDLAADRYFESVEDPAIGPLRIRNAQCRITPAATAPARPAPRIGDSTDDVLRDLLGLSDAGIAGLRREGVLS
ncbi:MAG: CoA transferase [Burkholderiaceae bacterium]|nr:CoA transferase [Burkholderiaceae bacterium]